MDRGSRAEEATAIHFHSMASSSSVAASGRNYDVFLSFQEDTRDTFTGHLCSNLRRKGIVTFMEEEEEEKTRRQGQIDPSILDAIKGSRFVIVVLSRNYVTSPRCLNELVSIDECLELNGQTMIPVFYRVEPLELRDRKGQLTRAMEEFEEKFKDNAEKVRKWRAAVLRASGIFGWKFCSGYESEIVERIAQDLSRRIGRTPLYTAEPPIGMDSLLNELKLLLGKASSETCVIRLCGINGIAKTAIAKACYNSLFGSFEGSSFLANVSATSKRYNGLVKLQEVLLNEIIGDEDNIKVVNLARGINLIRERLRGRRVLIVLDDVDHLDQLEALAGSRDWFGLGSRVIITARDERLLVVQGVDRRYKIDELCDGNGDAFRHLESSHDEFREMYKANLNALGDQERAILLDIACFFRGENKDHVVKMLSSCNFYPDINVPVLVDKSLIHIKGNKLQINDLVQQMGRDIVRRESQNPGDCSRLWFHDDVLQVLEGNTGTDEIEGILVDLPGANEIGLDADAFANMKRLRLLIVKNACFSSEPKCLPNELRWLEWNNYPSLSLPSDFRPKKLTVLKLHSSSIVQLWDGFKMCSNLAIVELTNCDSLCEIPDASAVPNLEMLMVNHCTSLVSVHESVGFLGKLIALSFKGCSNLRRIPENLRLVSLESLNLSGCLNLDKFPDISASMEHVESVDFSDTAIKELPSSIENLTGLRSLGLNYCRNIKALPSNIYSLPKIKHLQLKGCTWLQKFPSYKSSLANLKTGFPMLESLDASSCAISNLNFLEAIDCFTKLQFLDLSRNNFFALPSCISQFSELKFLHLEDCKQLTEIPKLPPSLTYLNAKGCASLERLHTRILQLTTIKLDFSNCHKLRETKRLLHKASFGDNEFQIIIPGSGIADWISYLSSNHSMGFEVQSPLLDNLLGLLVSTAFCLKDRVSVILKCNISINGETVVSSVSDVDGSLELDHMWLGYFPLSGRVEVIRDGWNQVSVSFRFLETDGKESSTVMLKGFGIRFLGNQCADDLILQPSKIPEIPNAAISEQNCRFAGDVISISCNLLPEKGKKKPCFLRRQKLRTGLISHLTPFKIRTRKRKRKLGVKNRSLNL